MLFILLFAAKTKSLVDFLSEARMVSAQYQNEAKKCYMNIRTYLSAAPSKARCSSHHQNRCPLSDLIAVFQRLVREAETLPALKSPVGEGLGFFFGFKVL
jgi:hypothetical protein